MNNDTSAQSIAVGHSKPPVISLILQKKFQDAGCNCTMLVDKKTTTLVITCKEKNFASRDKLETMPDN